MDARYLDDENDQYSRAEALLVYGVRVINQSFGMQGDEWSENHFVIYLLLGRNPVGTAWSFRLDVRPNLQSPHTDPPGFLKSSLYMKMQSHVASTDSLKCVDFLTRSCSSTPDEQRMRYANPQAREERSVKDFVNAIVSADSGIVYYFVDVPGAGPAGCRHLWYVRLLYRATGRLTRARNTIIHYYTRSGLLPQSGHNRASASALDQVIRGRYYRDDDGTVQRKEAAIIPGFWASHQRRASLDHPLPRYLDHAGKALLRNLENAYAVIKPKASRAFKDARKSYDNDSPLESMAALTRALGLASQRSGDGRDRQQNTWESEPSTSDEESDDDDDDDEE